MDYILIKIINGIGRTETIKSYIHRYGADEVLYNMLRMYKNLCLDKPALKNDAPRESKLKWYLDKIEGFVESLSIEKRGDKYRYSIAVENSKFYMTGSWARTRFTINEGDKVIISTPYMSMENKTRSDLFEFETFLHSPKFYSSHSNKLELDISDGTPEEEKLIGGILNKHIDKNISISTLLNEYVDSLRKQIADLKNKEIAIKLNNEISKVDIKYIGKYINIEKYCNRINDVYGSKGEEYATYANTTEFFYFISPYKKLTEMFVKAIPQHVAEKYTGITLFNRSGKLEVEIEMIRSIMDTHGEELTDEFLKLGN